MNPPAHAARLALSCWSLLMALAISGCGEKAATVEPTPAPQPQAAAPAAALPVAAPAPPPQPVDRPVRADGEFRAVHIVDSGFGPPVTAMTAEVPSDWNTRGGIRWDRNAPCISNRMRVEWSASSPDGRHAVEIIPGFAWQVRGYDIRMNPCPSAPIDSVRGYLEAMARELYPGATIVGYRERPDLVAEAESGSQEAPPQGMRRFQQAGEIGITYPGKGGTMRENLSALATFTEIGASRMGMVGSAFVVRAPQGDEVGPVAERIRKSMKANREWAGQLAAYGREAANREGAEQSAAISRWHNQRMAEISAKGAADRAAIRSQTARDVADINAAGWKSRQDSLDRMHRDNVDTIREVNRYADPSNNRQVELSSHYNHGFRTGDGSYVATDNPNFNPGSGGEELKRLR